MKKYVYFVYFHRVDNLGNAKGNSTITINKKIENGKDISDTEAFIRESLSAQRFPTTHTVLLANFILINEIETDEQ